MRIPRSPAPDQSGTASGVPPKRAIWRRLEPLFWIVLLGVIVTIQWPVLKGWYYRGVGTSAPPASFTWVGTLEQGLAQARSQGKLVLVDFRASWCPPCIAMQHDVWPDREVGRLLTARYVPVEIDVDRDPEGVADRYQVDTIPTILVLSPEGKVLRSGAYLPRAGMVRFLEEGVR